MTHLLRTALLILPLACTDGTGTQTDDTGPTADSGTVAVDDLSISDVVGEVDGVTVTIIHVSYTLSAAATTYVSFHTGDGEWSSSPAVDAEAGGVETIIVGVPAQTDVTWKVVAEQGSGTKESAEQLTRTGVLPSILPEFLLAVNDPTGWEHPFIMGTVGTSSVNQWAVWVLNREGQVVWYHLPEEGFWAPYVKLALDGKSFLFNGRNTSENDERLFRMGIDGELHQEWFLEGLTHAFAELDDGSIVYPAEVGMDEEVTRVYPDGSKEVIWTCSQWFQETGNPNLPCFHNGLNWYVDRGTFLISFYNLDTIAEVDIATGTTIRSFGSVGTSYKFTDRNISFDFQHHPTWTSRGYLMTTSSDPPGETWAREFSVDEANETITEEWHYGEGEGLEAKTIGEATRLSNDNTLMNWGETPAIREVKLDGTVVWDGFMAGARFMGRIQPIEDLYDLYCPGCYAE